MVKVRVRVSLMRIHSVIPPWDLEQTDLGVRVRVKVRVWVGKAV